MAFSEAIDYHDQYADEVTQFKPTHMNLPIDQLDYQVGVNAAAILLRLQPTDFVIDDADGEIVTDDADGEPVVDM